MLCVAVFGGWFRCLSSFWHCSFELVSRPMALLDGRSPYWRPLRRSLDFQACNCRTHIWFYTLLLWAFSSLVHCWALQSPVNMLNMFSLVFFTCAFECFLLGLARSPVNMLNMFSQSTTKPLMSHWPWNPTIDSLIQGDQQTPRTHLIMVKSLIHCSPVTCA